MEKLKIEEDMYRFIGTEVVLCLKSDKQIGGLLVEIDQEYAFIQIGVKVIVVPKDNIEYYETVGFVNNIKVDNKIINSNNQVDINVSVDDVYVLSIPVPPNINIASCTAELLDYVLANKELQNVLTGKVMRNVIYDIGKMNIVTKVSNTTAQTSSNIFNFSPNVTGQSLSPFDFVTNKK